MIVFRGDFLPDNYKEVKITIEVINSNKKLVVYNPAWYGTVDGGQMYRIAVSHELNIDIPCKNIKFIQNDSKY